MKNSNKKGAVVLFFSAIAMIVIFGIVLLLFATRLPEIEYIGSTQISLLNAYEFTENTFSYIDMSVELASERASERLAREGGQLRFEFELQREDYPCGQVVYPLIGGAQGVDGCSPLKEDDFERAFRSEFNKLLAGYDKLDLRDYEYVVQVEIIESSEIHTRVEFLTPIRFPLYPSASVYREAYSSENWIGIMKTNEYVENEYGYLERGGLPYGSRGNREVDSVVMHYTGGNSVDVAYDALFEQGFSYHYLIARDGTIYQFVPEDRAAWHAGGCEERSQDQFCRSRYEECIACIPGYNSRSIGISFIGCGFSRAECKIDTCFRGEENGMCWDPFTEDQFESAAELVAGIAVRHPDFNIETANIVSHSDIAADKSDPGPGFDERRGDFLRMAREHYEELISEG